MASGRIMILVQCELLPNHIFEGRRALLELAKTVQETEAECLSIEMAHNQDFPTKITMIEQWASREAYEGPHMQSAHMQAFIQNSSHLFTGPPEVSFCDVTLVAGQHH